MAQAANITINDGSATPVAHTLTPIGTDAKGVMFFEQITPSPVSPLGAIRIGYKQTRALDTKAQNGVSKCILTIHVPTLEVLGNSSTGITPPPTVAYKQVGRIELDLPERGQTAERKNLRVFLANLLANSQIVSAIDALIPMY